jgi:hypothetical protein
MATGEQDKNGTGSMVPAFLDSAGSQFARIETIPGLSLNSPRKESSVRVDGSTVEFEVYYGGSACDIISYTFEARSDSLHIIEKSETCYRHGQRYGVKGDIKNLKSGSYTFAVIRQFEENRSLTVFQKEIKIP